MFSKARFCQSIFKIPNTANLLDPLSRHVYSHNHHWCELHGISEYALPEFSVLERHKRLTKGRLTNT